MCRAVVGCQRLPIREYAGETLERLITDYPGRYRGTASFAGASELIQSRLGFGYQTSRQDFTWAGNRSSQNVIASAPGSSGKFLVLGAHYDTTTVARPCRAWTITPRARRCSPRSPATSAASPGERPRGRFRRRGGRPARFACLRRVPRRQPARQPAGNDQPRQPGHRRQDVRPCPPTACPTRPSAPTANRSCASPASLDIPLFTNPGLNAEYPAGTGCCSDGESFNGMDIPVLFIEATNWELGDLDGYEQTDNPAIPGGSTWHDPAEDNKEVLTFPALTRLVRCQRRPAPPPPLARHGSSCSASTRH